MHDSEEQAVNLKSGLSTKEEHTPTPPFWLSLIPLLVTAVVLGYSIFVLDTEPHFSLFIGGVTAGLCAYFNGTSWKVIKEGFRQAIDRAIPSLIILLVIGMLIGVWIASGIVPAIMHYTLELVVARWFLPLILIACSAMALVTGSSWSTLGTIGVAAVGAGEAMGIPAAMTAGAVVSGSFFGDKISPMSDSTNLTPSVLGVNLFEHIKHMLYTTVPSLGITLVFFTILGFIVSPSGEIADVSRYTDYIQQHFVFSPWLLIPPIGVILLIIKKIPAIPSLIAGVVLGSLIFMTVQNGSLERLSDIVYHGVAMDTGNRDLDELFTRGGLESMYSVVVLAFVSLAFGGIMNYTGMLHSIVLKLAALLRSIGSLTATVIGTSVLINVLAANQYLAVILPGQMYEECYRNHRLKLKNLTRTLEAGGTLTAPLIPWNSSGVFVFISLGVPVLQYAPYALLCWLTAVIMIIYGFFGITMERTHRPDEEPDDQQ